MVKIHRNLKCIFLVIVAVVLFAYLYNTYREGFIETVPAMTSQQTQEAAADTINSSPLLSKIYSIMFWITLIGLIGIIVLWIILIINTPRVDTSNVAARLKAYRTKPNVTPWGTPS